MAEAPRKTARLLVVEVNPKLPRTFGLPPAHPHALHERDIDFVVESDRPVIATQCWQSRLSTCSTTSLLRRWSTRH